MAEPEAKKPPKSKESPEALSNIFSANWKRHIINQNRVPIDYKPIVHVDFPDQLFGIEFEVENIRSLPDSFYDYFVVTEDGSLRNHGREFTYCGKGKAISHMLSYYHENLPKNAEFSPRTSIHVHINCRDMTASQLLGFMALSLLYERNFYDFCGHERTSSAFCVPAYKTALPGILRKYLGNWENSKDLLSSIPALIKVWSKYLGTNIIPLNSFGTVEFRQMRGHRDITEIALWINLIASMKWYAMKTPLKQIIHSIKELNTNSQYELFSMSVFGMYAKALIGSNRQKFFTQMEGGVISIKHSFTTTENVVKFLRSAKEDSSYYKTFPKEIIFNRQKGGNLVFPESNIYFSQFLRLNLDHYDENSRVAGDFIHGLEWMGRYIYYWIYGLRPDQYSSIQYNEEFPELRVDEDMMIFLAMRRLVCKSMQHKLINGFDWEVYGRTTWPNDNEQLRRRRAQAVYDDAFQSINQRIAFIETLITENFNIRRERGIHISDLFFEQEEPVGIVNDVPRWPAVGGGGGVERAARLGGARDNLAVEAEGRVRNDIIPARFRNQIIRDIEIRPAAGAQWPADVNNDDDVADDQPEEEQN